MNYSSNQLHFTILFLLALNILLGEDEANKNSPPKPEDKSQKEEKQTIIKGILQKEEGQDKNQNYFILTDDKKQVYLPKKIGEKEIDFATLLNKKVITKVKGELKENKVKTTTAIILTMEFNQLLSIELDPESNKKPDDKKKDLGNKGPD